MKYLSILIVFIFSPSNFETKNEFTQNQNIKTTSSISKQLKPLKLEKTEVIYNYYNEEFDHSSFSTLLKKYVSTQGKVDYNGLKSQNKLLRNYIKSLSSNTPKEKWNDSNKLAYWINAYNALTIDLIIRNYPLKSIKDLKDPWDQKLWKFGDKWLNLNDIEHQILRKMNEPRIHFAIVCASESCPKLQNTAFTASNLEEQLTNATKGFLSDTSKNEISKNNIKLSKIFKWFKKDFERNGSIIDFLNQYSDIEISNKAKKSFKDYNWDLNE
ncbi:DUF547 domain-containing protein [Winogradskyella sp.]|jgi:hypothetical protein|uniref:DUF547 domain-containing protein n=1 Tax=Winogradskyella sp. TaxID=1883156 RepID=UPI0025E8B431|nr:DUF547 domain-containing protein [Winogradskyella sp.]MCT4629862.1 DUF547 domain-containing protein [Winogradskyella sp.]